MLGHQSKRRWIAALAAAGAAFALAGCGGGDGDGVGSGGTGSSYGKGVITGFGSVIVNGVHYDDDGADVLDDKGGSASNDDLKLGMVVEIQGGEITTDDDGTPRASASTIRFASELKGPVEAIDVAAGTLVVLGQTVKVDVNTVFDDSLPGGLAALELGDLVEIYAFRGSDGTYTATRIEDDLVASGEDFKLRGSVNSLDTSLGTFRIGNTVIVYAGLAAPGLADGVEVRVEVSSVLNTDGFYVAEELEVKGDDDDHDADEAKVEGIAASVDGSSFVVNGIAVDASGVTLPSGFGAGVRVEVEGELVNGVLVASKVEIEDEGGGGETELEVEGVIASIDTAAKTFVVRGVTISYTGSVRFDDGTEADLAAGVEVEVKGVLAPDGNTLQAERIKFED